MLYKQFLSTVFCTGLGLRVKKTVGPIFGGRGGPCLARTWDMADAGLRVFLDRERGTAVLCMVQWRASGRTAVELDTRKDFEWRRV